MKKAISLQDKVKELTAEKAAKKAEKDAAKKKMSGLRADAPERWEINEQHKKAAAALKAKEEELELTKQQAEEAKKDAHEEIIKHNDTMGRRQGEAPIDVEEEGNFNTRAAIMRNRGLQKAKGAETEEEQQAELKKSGGCRGRGCA